MPTNDQHTFSANFPQYRIYGSETKWTFTWREDGWEYNGIRHNLIIKLRDDTIDGMYHTYLSGALGQSYIRLPADFWCSLRYLWDLVAKGVTDDEIQSEFESLGKWCIATNNSAPQHGHLATYFGTSQRLL